MESGVVRIQHSARTVLLGAALCLALVSAGCSGAATKAFTSITGIPAAAPHTDWAFASLLAGGSVGVDQFPAKYTFDVNATPDCMKDFVAYNTGLTGASGSAANIVAFNELYSSQQWLPTGRYLWHKWTICLLGHISQARARP